jgi:hypothetical protein
VGRWIRKISLSVAVFAPKNEILKWGRYFVKNNQKTRKFHEILCFFGFGRKNLPIGIKLRRAFVRRVAER